MRMLIATYVGVAIFGLAIVAKSTHVEGALVYGKVKELSANETHEAIIASGFQSPVAVEVVSSTEVHVYASRDLGWRRVRYTEVNEPDGSKHREWESDGLGIPGIPGIFEFISAADVVYVFPNITPLDPHRDDKRSRQLGPEGRRDLVRLLGHEEHWLHGFDNRFGSGKESANVGFLFQRGRSELVLFLSGDGRLQGTFKGEHTGGSLMRDAARALDSWKGKYAQEELPFH
ncbi:hypothetical protein [Rhodanobacter sp. L36]|uniref:hypothetical protein n=1 Tax=Rhodanobacter sp. L36 TaxID=1747221 RepID=UPI00131E21B8|nr:hypothetical protein [Rhodanobacter sp. L36]